MTRKSGWKKEQDSLFSTPILAMWLVFGITGLYGYLQVDLGQFDNQTKYSPDYFRHEYPQISPAPNSPLIVHELNQPNYFEDTEREIFIPRGNYSGMYLFRADGLARIKIYNDTHTFLHGESSTAKTWRQSNIYIHSDEDTFAKLEVRGQLILCFANWTISQSFVTNNGLNSFQGKQFDVPIVNFVIFNSTHRDKDTTFLASFQIFKSGGPFELTIYDPYFNKVIERKDLTGSNQFQFRWPHHATLFLVSIFSIESGYELIMEFEIEADETKAEQYQKAGMSATLLAVPIAISLFFWVERRSRKEED